MLEASVDRFGGSVARAGAVEVGQDVRTVSKSKSDGLWWSRDSAGHGGSACKVNEESSRGLIWRADANQYGDFIVGKHKSDIGTFIPWKDLH